MAIDPTLAQAIVDPRVPDIVGAYRQGAEARRGRDIRSLTGQVLSGEGGMSELQKLSPQVAMQLSQHFRSTDAASLESTIRDSRIIQSMLESGDIQGAYRRLEQRSAEKQMRGEDVSQTEKLRTMLQQDPSGQSVLNELIPFNKAIDDEQGRTLAQGKLDLEREKYGIGREAGESKAESAKIEQTRKAAKDLRKEWRDMTVDVRKIESAYQRLQAVSKTGSAASDMALIFNFMKINDPGSTVREGEYATAQNATNAPGQVRNWYNKMVDGAKLNDTQRADFVAQGEALYKSQRRVADRKTKQILEIADFEGVNPIHVLGKSELTKHRKRLKEQKKAADDDTAIRENTEEDIDEVVKGYNADRASRGLSPMTREEVVDALEQPNAK